MNSNKVSTPSQPNILFILTGSIACYKACTVISKLVQASMNVQVVATESALKFVGEATLEGLTGKTVAHDLYASGNMMDHIHLVRNADLIIVAPTTANYINKISQGLADDLASTLFLAHDFKKPFIIAPAMNSSMYSHPITQQSLLKLKSLGVIVLDTDSGYLACGEEGLGKLLDPEIIFKNIYSNLGRSNPANTVSSSANTVSSKILITAGGTQEKIDSVRSITNTSTGHTGVSLAENLYINGYDVTLLLSENSVKFSKAKEDFSNKPGFNLISFSDFNDFRKKLYQKIEQESFDYLIHGAAVSDYSISEVVTLVDKDRSTRKISSDNSEITIKLKKNPKLIEEIKSRSQNKNIKLIGFKLTVNADESEIDEKVKKLFVKSNSDYVIHNDLRQIDKAHNLHSYSFYDKNCALPTAISNTEELSKKIIQVITNEANL